MGDIDRFIYEAREVIQNLPGFNLDVSGAEPKLHGTIEIHNDAGDVIDSYQIKITTGNYPETFPKVYEIGGKIPRNIEWHIYPTEGNCCIAIPREERKKCIQGLRLIQFIQEDVTPYFYNQNYRRINGFFYNEHLHGMAAVIKDYADILQVNSIPEIVFLLNAIAESGNLHRNAPCLCGSQKKFKDCHRKAYQELSPLGREYLLQNSILIFQLYIRQ